MLFRGIPICFILISHVKNFGASSQPFLEGLRSTEVSKPETDNENNNRNGTMLSKIEYLTDNDTQRNSTHIAMIDRSSNYSSNSAIRGTQIDPKRLTNITSLSIHSRKFTNSDHASGNELRKWTETTPELHDSVDLRLNLIAVKL